MLGYRLTQSNKHGYAYFLSTGHERRKNERDCFSGPVPPSSCKLEISVHDLVLEYLQMTAKIDEDLARQGSPRQARFLSRIEVLRRYSAGDETFSNGGLYSIVALWDAVTNLDRSQ